jgi:hypothetical protein
MKSACTTPEATEARRKEAVEMRINGFKLREIAERFGITKQRVEQILRTTEVEGLAAVTKPLEWKANWEAVDRIIAGDAGIDKHGRKLVMVECLLCGHQKAAVPYLARGCRCKTIQKLRSKGADLTGQVFGEYVVLARGTKAAHWLCRCSCGCEKEVMVSNLVQGRSPHCASCAARKRWDRLRANA